MIDAGKEFEKCVSEIVDPQEKLLFGQGFVKGFKLGLKVNRENAKKAIAEAFELLAKGKLSEEMEKLKREAGKEVR